jgi:hypothetical protein
MGDRVKTDRLMGNVAAVLLDYVGANDIDLVVMCSHGRSGLSRFAPGQSAARGSYRFDTLSSPAGHRAVAVSSQPSATIKVRPVPRS